MLQTKGKYDFSNISVERMALILDKWVASRTEEKNGEKCLYIHTISDFMDPLEVGELISTLGICIYKVLCNNYAGMVVEYSDRSGSVHGMFDREDLELLSDKAGKYVRNELFDQIQSVFINNSFRLP